MTAATAWIKSKGDASYTMTDDNDKLLYNIDWGLTETMCPLYLIMFSIGSELRLKSSIYYIKYMDSYFNWASVLNLWFNPTLSIKGQ